ncbi:MAG TPA: DUF6531 domain-containing protein, partial [Thermoanaerobaculia bacterium]|nr:DUF6531 domain-containing protein [Thermoanaerobaculia bacterium]
MGSGYQAVVNYAFPQTDAPAQRQLRLETVPGGSVLATAQSATVRGAWTVNLACPAATVQKIRAVAVACGDEQVADEKDVTSQKPVVDVVLDRVVESGKLKATVTYTVLPAGASARLKVDVLAAYDENGAPVPQFGLFDGNVTDTGTKEFLIDPIAGALQVVVNARLSNCREAVEKDAAVGCMSCDYAPRSSGDPVAFSDADMRYTDSEPLPPILGAALSRTYDSHHQMRGVFGRGWTTLFDQRMVVTQRPEGELVYFTTETNDAVVFALEGGAYVQRWPTSTNGTGTLVKDISGGVYIYRAPNAATQSLFRISDGRFAGWRQLATARSLTVAYDGNGLPLNVTDSWTGVKWLLTTDSSNRRINSIAVEGHPEITWTYQYTARNLTTVLAPGSTPWRTYEYENNRMTASRDAAGRLIESHTFDANGAAKSSTGARDEIALFEYNLPHPAGRVTRVTTRSGGVTDYVLAPAGGAWRTIQVIGGCSACGGRNSSYVYDTDGHTVRQQNASGYVTLRTYAAGRLATEQNHLRPTGCDPETHPTRCRLDSASLAAAAVEATAASVTTTYAYADPQWPDKATMIATTSVLSPTSTRRETFVYDGVT